MKSCFVCSMHLFSINDKALEIKLRNIPIVKEEIYIPLK
jgi:hypothetical protein